METLQRTANRGSVSTGYDIDNSLKLESDNSERLHKTPSGAGNRRTFTISFWTKRTKINGVKQYLFEAGNSDADHDRFTIRFGTGDTLDIQTSATYLITNRVFRDTAAWYHIVVKVDTTDGTAANRIKLYVNGVEETSFATDNRANINQNFDFSVNNTEIHNIGSSPIEGGLPYNGYIAEWVQIDGTASAPTAFGEVDEDSGIWKPINVSGLTFGTNGFYLDFEASGDLGNDANGGTDFTLVNIAAKDQATDTPTNNFCTLNPLVNFKYTTNGIFEGGTQYGNSTGGGKGGAFGTMAVTSGKWYWEVKLIQQVSHYIGVSAIDDGDDVKATSDPEDVNSTFNFNISAARIEYHNNGSKVNGSLDAFTDFHTAGDIISIALNMDDNQISIYGNGTLQAGVANTSLFDAANKMVVPFHATINDQVQYNFGGYSAYTESSPVSDENGYGTFEYAPPTGYYALCTKNLALYGG
tara:strand:- start:1354 stop:2760 length:1407 start_codon:yes stop_codon:yes gene_type:complete